MKKYVNGEFIEMTQEEVTAYEQMIKSEPVFGGG